MLTGLHIIGLVALILVGGWLSGYDSNLAGDGRAGDYWHRFLRVLATVFLVELMIVFPPATLVLLVGVGVIWASCGAELGSRAFRNFLDPASYDERTFDAGKTQRYLDTIAHLIRTGKRDDAIRLCEELKQTGEVPLTTLEDTLEYLGVNQGRGAVVSPIVAASRLRAAGKPQAAEPVLLKLLAQNPSHTQAAMLLMRIYAQDLRLPERAAAILRKWECQPRVDPAHIEFARRSLAEWNQAPPETDEPAPPAPAESLEELLANGSYGSAIEMLEQQTKESPADISAWLKLAEVHGRFCHNLPRAEKIIRQLEVNPAFTPEQKQQARTRLKEWRESKASGTA